jgi:anti-sigma28 factor (negative regulator of flagellin synthesis)
MKVKEPKVLLHPLVGGSTGRVSNGVGASDVGLLASLKSEMGPLDVLREEKVTRLRAVIARGNYNADVHDVARGLLREVLGQLLA